jgi:molybdopterin converting factor small subunit
MTVAVRYMAQLRHAAGLAQEQVELPAACTVQELLIQMAERHGDPLQRLLLAADRILHPTILLFVGDEQVGTDERVLLKDGDVVTVLAPVAGGSR